MSHIKMIPESSASAVSYGTSGTGLATGMMTANEMLAYVSMFFIALTWATNLYYKRRQDKRMERAEKAGRLIEVKTDND